MRTNRRRPSEPPNEIFAAIPNTVNTPELRVEMQEGEPQNLVKELTTAIATDKNFTTATISKIDGIRADFKTGFGLIRASNTTPALIMRFEANNKAKLKTIQNKFRKLLNKVNAELPLPF